MLLSFARCGPSALAPSLPMLLPASDSSSTECSLPCMLPMMLLSSTLQIQTCEAPSVEHGRQKWHCPRASCAPDKTPEYKRA